MSITRFMGQLLRYGQNYLVYPAAFLDRPRRINTPAGYGLPYEDVQLRTSDGVTIYGYLLRFSNDIADKDTTVEMSEIPRGSVIMFHGNAMNYGDCIEGAIAYFKMRYNVLIMSYRGYGHSEGSPSEKGLRKDAQAGLDYLLTHPQLSQLPIILSGQSLGGAVAIDLASRNPSKIQALIIENTFTSLPDIVRAWPLIGPFSFLCHQRWNSAAKMYKIPKTLPILMLSGERDEVVPREHMCRLWDKAQTRGGKKCKNRSKAKAKGKKGEEASMTKEGSDYELVKDTNTSSKDSFQSFERGLHANTFIQPGYWDAIECFLFSLDQ